MPAIVSASSSAPFTAACLRAASSEAVRRALGLVDSVSVTQRSTTSSSIRSSRAEVEDRRLGEAPDQLVDRGEDQVGAGLERARGQERREAQVRAPGLVDDQRNAALVRHLGESARRRRPRRSRWARRSARATASGRRVERLGERLRGQAVGDPELRVELGRDERRLEPGEDDPVDRARVDVPLGDDRRPEWRSARQAAWFPCDAPLIRNQLRFAPQASAASRWACWNGESGPMSIPSMPAGMSWSNAFEPSVSTSSGSRPAPPCGPGR